MNDKERIDVFKASCNVYKKEKTELEAYMNSTLQQNPIQKQLYDYIREDVEYVESVMDRILKTCGPDARVLTWLLYVDRNNQTTVAEECCISRRQLQYSMEQWKQQALHNTTMNEKEYLHALRASLRMYPWEKKKIETYKGAETDAVQKVFYTYLKEDMQIAEYTLKLVKTNCHEKIFNMLYSVYVEGKTQEETAKENQISRRMLQYRLKKVIERC